MDRSDRSDTRPSCSSVALVYPVRADFEPNRGILNKFAFQATAFSRLGLDVDTYCGSFAGVLRNGSLETHYFREHGIWRQINYYGVFYSHVLKLMRGRKYDLVYVRNPLANPAYVAFLAGVRRANPTARIVLEVPAYPYQKEASGVSQRLLLLSDAISSPALHLVVDRVVTFCGQDRIFGIPCIQLSNGIDVAKLALRKPKAAGRRELRILGVANVAKWHGFDRALRGLQILRDRTPERHVRFDVVGDGPELNALRELSSRLKLDGNVVFHGMKTGASLDALFDDADVALGTLAPARARSGVISSLKTREYCARGIPFVQVSPDSDFPESFPFQLRIEDGEDAIDVAAIAEWLERTIATHADHPRKMRDFAERELGWERRLSAVLAAVGLEPKLPT